MRAEPLPAEPSTAEGCSEPRSAPARRRVLLLGASGRLGAAIEQALAPLATARSGPVEFDAPRRDALALDPAKPQEAVERWFGQWRPDIVIDCIAMSDVDRCESEPVRAQQLNAALPAALARTARRSNARLVHFSTDFVFDGASSRPYREDDPAHPLSVYGATKLAGERAITAEGGAHWIFRISWLYGARQGNLAALLLDPANAGRVIPLASNRFGVPNPVQLLATEVAECIATAGDATAAGRTPSALPPSGLYHLSCHGVTTWHEFGRAFLREAVRTGRLPAGQAPVIEAIDETTLARDARRPPFSALDPGRYERCFGREMPDWESAIRLALM